MVMTNPWLEAALAADTTPGFLDVVEEVAASCRQRARPGHLLEALGVVGVLAGPAPVVWVHGPVSVPHLCDALARSREVGEVYVAAGQRAAVRALRAAGWESGETVMQMVHDGCELLQAVDGLPAVRRLERSDLADVRDLMRRERGADEAQLAACYGDDFFTAAAPVWMFGARDGGRRLVGVAAVRRQVRSAMGFGLAVDSGWRTTGLATALVAAAVRQATDSGTEFVHALAGERSSRRLADCGFAAVGTWLRMVRG